MKREKQTTSLNKLIIKVKEGERIQKNIGHLGNLINKKSKKILEEYFENITL